MDIVSSRELEYSLENYNLHTAAVDMEGEGYTRPQLVLARIGALCALLVPHHETSRRHLTRFDCDRFWNKEANEES